MRFLLCLCLAVMAAFPQSLRRDHHVILISIDGFAAYSLADPKLPVPNIRELIRNGVAASGMRPVNPTVTWPNHTSLVTGRPPAAHSVIYNGWAVRGGEGQPLRVEPRVPRRELVQGETLYDQARKAGLTTAQVDWVAIEDAEGIHWAFSEWPSETGAVEQEMMAAGLVTAAEIRDFNRSPITLRDEIWTRAAEHILLAHKPNLLLFHLLTTDSAQHRYGARSLAGDTALALADAKVGRLIEAARRADILEKTTFIIVSDHGFKTYSRLIRPNALLRQKGLGGEAYVIPEGGTAMVYSTRQATKTRTLDQLRTIFQGLEGVDRILTPADFASFGYPDPAKNPRMADLVLSAKDGYAFHGADDGDPVVSVPSGSTPGGHGYLSTDPDMLAVFVASGAGIRKGASPGEISNLDVAPTIRSLLGLPQVETQGRVLSTILR